MGERMGRGARAAEALTEVRVWNRVRVGDLSARSYLNLFVTRQPINQQL
jgi:hypothetical protein